MFELFKKIDDQLEGYFEFRYHNMVQKKITYVNDTIKKVPLNSYVGVGIRCFYNEGVGFASTSAIRENDIIECAKNAQLIAKLSSLKTKAPVFPGCTSEYFSKIPQNEIVDIALNDKLLFLKELNAAMKSVSPKVSSVYLILGEQYNEKNIYTSDGGKIRGSDRQIVLYLNAHAHDKGVLEKCADIYRFRGSWNYFLQAFSWNEIGKEISRSAVEKLNASHPKNGIQQVILGPKVVGTLIHEAIGHGVEADFVLAGSAATGKIDAKVAADQVNIIDFGVHVDFPDAPVRMEFDDEGIETQTVEIVKDGYLKSYLHNRETAKEYGVQPTGNARALKYFDEPLIRMRNTCMLPGKREVKEMIKEVDFGYYLTKMYNGQADINGEFNFSILEGYLIDKGELIRPVKDHTISGQAFEVLKTVDAISTDFQWNNGVCGKDQLAIVGQGGPAIRCMLKIGGK